VWLSGYGPFSGVTEGLGFSLMQVTVSLTGGSNLFMASIVLLAYFWLPAVYTTATARVFAKRLLDDGSSHDRIKTVR